MFIKVISLTGGTLLINADKIYCVVDHEGGSEIIYTDDSSLLVNESIVEIVRMLKGVDDGEMA